MKFHWGIAIVVSFILLIGFMSYFLIQIETKDSLNHTLVTKEYYKQELKTEQHLTALKNGEKWIDSIEVLISKEGVLLKKLPKYSILIEGYRPSNNLLDFAVEVSPKEEYYLIPTTLLERGRWNINVSWQQDKQPYKIEKKLYY